MTEPLEHRLRRLMALHPPLKRGALGWRGLVGLAHRVVGKLDLRCSVVLRANPFRGHVSRVGSRVTFTIDAALGKHERCQVLAHEVGHVALGHYQLDDEVWYYTDDPIGDPQEEEADLFEVVALRSMFYPLDFIIRPEQLRLPLKGPYAGPMEIAVRSEIRRSPARIRTASGKAPKPKVAELLELFAEQGY